jgi:pilus assembly protein Flp/PilA
MQKFYATMFSLVAVAQNRIREEKGATAVEYGLLVGLIAVAIIVTVGLLGTKLNTLFTSIKDALPGGAAPAAPAAG